jgi:hypothetical protein
MTVSLVARRRGVANLLSGSPAPARLNRGDDLNVIRRVDHTVVCLTLAKWETVSGQFGGYLNTVCEGSSA